MAALPPSPSNSPRAQDVFGVERAQEQRHGLAARRVVAVREHDATLSGTSHQTCPEPISPRVRSSHRDAPPAGAVHFAWDGGDAYLPVTAWPPLDQHLVARPRLPRRGSMPCSRGDASIAALRCQVSHVRGEAPSCSDVGYRYHDARAVRRPCRSSSTGIACEDRRLLSWVQSVAVQHHTTSPDAADARVGARSVPRERRSDDVLGILKSGSRHRGAGPVPSQWAKAP